MTYPTLTDIDQELKHPSCLHHLPIFFFMVKVPTYSPLPVKTILPMKTIKLRSTSNVSGEEQLSSSESTHVQMRVGKGMP
jgi:hypothetical protein